jgi:hypothetical protein
VPTQTSNLSGKPGMRVRLLMGQVEDLRCGLSNPNGDVTKTKGLEKASYLLGGRARTKRYVISSDPCITLFLIHPHCQACQRWLQFRSLIKCIQDDMANGKTASIAIEDLEGLCAGRTLLQLQVALWQKGQRTKKTSLNTAASSPQA